MAQIFNQIVAQIFNLRNPGRTYAGEWQLDRAIQTYQQVLQDYPGTAQDWWCKYYMAKAYIASERRGKPPEQSVSLAIPVLEELARHYPNHPEGCRVLYWLGRSYKQVGDDQAALDTYLKAIDLYPGTAARCFPLAIGLLQKAGRWDESIALGRRYVEAVEALPEGATEHTPIDGKLLAAVGYASKGDAAAAVQEIEEAITRYPDKLHECADRCWKIADRIYRHGGGDELGPLAQGMLDRHPEGEHAAFAKLAMGESLRRAGDTTAAVGWFERVIAEHPQSAFVHSARLWAGWCLLFPRDNPFEAIPYLQQVVSKDSHDWRRGRALVYLVHCYLKLEDYDNGLAACQRFLSQSASEYAFSHGFAHKTMGYIYYRQKEYDKAREELELTIADYPGTGWDEEAKSILAQIAAAGQGEAAEGGE